MLKSQPSIAILYEHPQWFQPLFDELDRRDIPYDKLLATHHSYDPRQRTSPYSLVVNRMSSSAYLRGNGNAILYVREYLRHLRDIGAEVINGYDAYLVETSKAKQIGIFESLGIRYPRTRIINHPFQALAAATVLKFPVVVKPNIGGKGANITLFQQPEELGLAVDLGALSLGLDSTALVQEYLPATEGSIIRMEILNGEFL